MKRIEQQDNARLTEQGRVAALNRREAAEKNFRVDIEALAIPGELDGLSWNCLGITFAQEAKIRGKFAGDEIYISYEKTPEVTEKYVESIEVESIEIDGEKWYGFFDRDGRSLIQADWPYVKTPQKAVEKMTEWGKAWNPENFTLARTKFSGKENVDGTGRCRITRRIK